MGPTAGCPSPPRQRAGLADPNRRTMPSNSRRQAGTAPGPASPSPARHPAVTVRGTTVNVLDQTIDVDASQGPAAIKATVDDPVMIGGSTVIPRNASAVLQAVQVQQSGKAKGADKISLKMNSIGFGGMVYEVSSAYVEQKGSGEGKRTARKVGGGAGLGAIVGGIAGGGSGAAIGAAVGGVTGAAVASAGEEHLKVPAETRLQFQLSAAVNIRP